MKNAFGFQFFPKGVGSIEFLFSTILMIAVFVRMRTQGTALVLANHLGKNMISVRAVVEPTL